VDGLGSLGSPKADEDAAAVIANIAYSRDVVSAVVNRLRLENPWATDPLVRRLGRTKTTAATFENPKASDGYITGLLKRLNLRRRRVTNLAKLRPSDTAIQDHQRGMQDTLTDLPPAAIVSGDETAWNWALRPRYQYVPLSVSGDGRATAPDSDEKQR
jgi:hypothetical protein